MKKGYKVRFHDIKAMSDLNPNILEFHFSDKDLECDFGRQQYDQELIVHVPEYWEGILIDPASTGEHIKRLSREESVRVIQMTLDKTKQMARHFTGDPLVVLHPGGMTLDPVDEAEKAAMREALKQSMSELNLEGLTVLLENMPPYPWFYGGQWLCNILLDAQEVRDFSEQTGYDVCFDLSHAQLYCTKEKKDMDEYITILKPCIKHFHIADAEGVDGEGLQIEEGEVNFARVMRHFKDYDMGIIPEIWYGHRNNGEGFLTAFERLDKYL